MNENNTQNKFDEMQLMTRRKIGTQAFFLTMIIVVLNGIISEFYVWATPAIQACILIYIPMIFYTTSLTFKNAYVVNTKKLKEMQLMNYISIVVYIGIFVYLYNSKGADILKIFIIDGVLQSGFAFILILITTIISTICTSIKLHLDNNNHLGDTL